MTDNQIQDGTRPLIAPDEYRLWPTLRAVLRTRIVAGLLTVIPIWVTWVIVKFVFDTMRSATQPIARSVAGKLMEKNKDWVPATVQSYFDWIVPLLAVLLTLFLLYLLGLLTANVFGRRIIRAVEGLFSKVPFVKTVYHSTKQIAMTLGGVESMNVKQVVLVDFPRPGVKRVAFLTSVLTDRDTGRKLAGVFIPYTPYLTTGYLQIMPLEEVSESNWTVEEAVKWIMSGGIISPPEVNFDRAHPVREEALREKKLPSHPSRPASK